MDERDYELAERLMNAELERALAKTRTTNKAPRGWDGYSCVDCDDEVGSARARLGYWTCVDCQTLRERRQRAK